MRFVFITLLACLTGSVFLDPVSVHAQDGSKIPVIYTEPPAAENIQKRRRSGSEKPQVSEGLRATVFASQIGDISSIAMHADGIIFAADQKRGQIIRLEDRARDGRLDMRRVIASGLERPSGLAVIDETVYIADVRAVWATPVQGGAISQIVDLSNSDSLPSPRFLWSSADKRSLILSVSGAGSPPRSRLVSVDVETGFARLIAQGDGVITALAVSVNDRIWVGVGNKVLPVSNGQFLHEAGQTFGKNVTVTGLALPGQFADHPEFLKTWRDHILVSQGGPLRPESNLFGGLNIVSIPTRFGQVADGVEVFADGFTDKFGRAAWGQPGPILVDGRGVFFADRWSGLIWHIGKAEDKPAEPIKEEPINAVVVEEDGEVPEETKTTLTGSSIKAGSKIEFGTSIKNGSSIPKSKPRPQPEDAGVKNEPEIRR